MKNTTTTTRGLVAYYTTRQVGREDLLCRVRAEAANLEEVERAARLLYLATDSPVLVSINTGGLYSYNHAGFRRDN